MKDEYFWKFAVHYRVARSEGRFFWMETVIKS